MTNRKLNPNSRWCKVNFTGESLQEKLQYADYLDLLFLLNPEDYLWLSNHAKWEIGDYDLKTGEICINILE